MSIISTRQDLDAIAATDPVEHARFISLLRASLTSRIDVAEYPECYDSTLTDGLPRNTKQSAVRLPRS